MFGLFKKKETYKFYHDEYVVWIILRKSTDLKLHDWKIWERCFQILNNLINNQPEKMTIRTSQSVPKTSTWLPFGRMIWNKKNNLKWTSKYKEGDNKVENIEFFDTEFWCPSWTICERENIAPDIFMKIDAMEKGLLNDLFDESLLIASKIKNDSVNQAIIEEIAEQIDAQYIIKGNRQWGRSVLENSWTDSLMDFSIYDLLNRENTIEFEIKDDNEIFGSWEVVKRYKK